MATKGRVFLVIFIATVTALARTALNITVPLLLDTTFGFSASNNTSSLSPHSWTDGHDAHMNRDLGSHSSGNSSNAVNATIFTISPYFVVTGQMLITTAIASVGLLIILVFFPWMITEHDLKFPKSQMMIPGIAQGVSTILVVYAMSGMRTPPYLQAVINNFNIPVQFIIRFAILRKRPTLFKLCCALTILVAEFVCLLPSIFPGLESSKQRNSEGGTTGIGRILFPMLMVLSMVPFAIGNAVMEKGVQEPWTSKTPAQGSALECQKYVKSTSPSPTTQVNLCYYLFWWSIACSSTLLVFFWTDFVPGYGTSSSIGEFAEKMKLDWLCAVGQAGCESGTILLLWLNFLFMATNFIFTTSFIRYSEGANFLVITMSLRTPLLFLFWTLFTEKPFEWAPHVALSTWLSIGGLVIMIPAACLYNFGAPEIVHIKKPCLFADQSPLLTNEYSWEDQEDEEDMSNGLINRGT